MYIQGLSNLIHLHIKSISDFYAFFSLTNQKSILSEYSFCIWFIRLSISTRHENIMEAGIPWNLGNMTLSLHRSYLSVTREKVWIDIEFENKWNPMKLYTYLILPIFLLPKSSLDHDYQFSLWILKVICSTQHSMKVICQIGSYVIQVWDNIFITAFFQYIHSTW